MQDELFVTCKCTSMDHVLRFSYEPEDREIYATVHLAPLPFRKRVWQAIRYIFGRRSRFGDFDEIILSNESVFRLLELLTCCGRDLVNDLKKSSE